MNQSNKLTNVILVLIVALLGAALIVFGISYFAIEPGGILEPQGEFSFGVSSKLGWLLTFGFFVLYLLFSLLRHLYYKMTGKG